MSTTGRNYVLTLLSIEDDDGRNEIRGSIWLQKIMYAASREHEELDYDFKPYRFGMHSSQLHDILMELESEKLVRINATDDDIRKPIDLTEKGRKVAADFECDPDIRHTINAVRSELNGLSYRELIVMTYTKYPQMLENSKLVDDYEKWREKVAISMFRDDKASFSLAAQLSGLGKKKFDDRLRQAVTDTVSDLFERYKNSRQYYETDYNDDMPFYRSLQYVITKQPDKVLDAISDCIFSLQQSEYRTIFPAIHFCGASNDAATAQKRISILTNILLNHPNKAVRREAVYALGDAGSIDDLQKAYIHETDSSIRYYAASDYIVKNDILKILDKTNVDERVWVSHMFAALYLLPEHMDSKYNTLFGESVNNLIERFGRDKMENIIHRMMRHKCTPDDVATTIAERLEMYVGSDMATSILKRSDNNCAILLGS